MEQAANRTECRPARQTAVLGLAGALALLVASRWSSAASGGDESSAAPVCGAWHRSGGDGEAFDLERTRREYQDLKDRMSNSLRRSLESEVGVKASRGYDSGLPGCGRNGERRVRLSREVPPELRGKMIWLSSFETRKHPAIAEHVTRDPNILIFATRVDRLETLAEVSKVLGKPISLMPRGLAEALGVRCAPALVSIRADGEVEIHENP